MSSAPHDREHFVSEEPAPADIGRRQFLKALGVGALAMSAGGVLSACSEPRASGPAAPGGGGEGGIALASVPSLSNEYFTLWKIGGEEAAEALGVTFRMQSYEGSSATQINQLRSAGAARASQVITFPINNDAVKEIGTILAGQKIPFATAFTATPWSVPSEPEFQGGYSGLFAPREVLGQQALSEAVFKAIGGGGNVIFIQGAPTDRTSILRERGFDQAVAKFPGIKVLGKEYGNQNGQDTRPVVQTFLSRFNNIDAIVCHNSSEALGAVSVLEEKGNTHIKVGGTDEQAAIIDKLIAGPNVVAVQSIFGTWLGGYMVVRNYDLANGVKLDPVERMIYQDALVIDTKEAAQEYKKIASGSSTGFDWKKMSRHLNPDSWDTQVALAANDPVEFFEKIFRVPRPAGHEFPDDLQQSLDSGGIDKYTKLYKEHAKNNPFASAIAKTTTRATVFGVGY
jgi:ABC-type sugar transport system substrate-binding protein